MRLDKNQEVFFALVKAGLWEDIKVNGEGLMVNDFSIDLFSSVDWQEVMRIAEEQTVEGLVTAGLEHIKDDRIPQDELLEFIGLALQIEQQNRLMNEFVADIVAKMRNVGIYTLLLKGMGIAQCYAKPLWRSCGDVDLFLSEDNYKKAKDFFEPLASEVEEESQYTQHLALTIDDWTIELHGNLRGGLFRSIDEELDSIKNDIFCGGNVRSWLNGRTQIFLPSINNEVVYVFSHILQHFFIRGIGLRQICDWCRLLWTYRDTIDKSLLEHRLKRMGVMSEWKAFGAFAVEYLGMPREAMPIYNSLNAQEVKKCKWKACKILEFIIKVGNFGHNRDMSYRLEVSAVTRKWKTFYHITADTVRQFSIFPLDSVKVWWTMMKIGLKGLVGR